MAEVFINDAEQRVVSKDPDLLLEAFVTGKGPETVEIRLELTAKRDAVLHVEKFPEAKVTRVGQPQEPPIRLKPGRYEFQITARRS